MGGGIGRLIDGVGRGGGGIGLVVGGGGRVNLVVGSGGIGVVLGGGGIGVVLGGAIDLQVEGGIMDAPGLAFAGCGRGLNEFGLFELEGGLNCVVLGFGFEGGGGIESTVALPVGGFGDIDGAVWFGLRCGDFGPCGRRIAWGVVEGLDRPGAQIFAGCPTGGFAGGFDAAPEDPWLATVLGDWVFL